MVNRPIRKGMINISFWYGRCRIRRNPEWKDRVGRAQWLTVRPGNAGLNLEQRGYLVHLYRTGAIIYDCADRAGASCWKNALPFFKRDEITFCINNQVACFDFSRGKSRAAIIERWQCWKYDCLVFSVQKINWTIVYRAHDYFRSLWRWIVYV